jgi:hypothetical protein
MVKRPVVIATHSFIGLSQAGYQDAFDNMAKQGFGPFIISATGPSGSAVFAASSGWTVVLSCGLAMSSRFLSKRTA